jgi:hypothetical protein
MSALPAEITELSPAPVAVRPGPAPAGSQLRAERRAEQAMVRRSRRRWAGLGIGVLMASFGATIGILDVLH